MQFIPSSFCRCFYYTCKEYFAAHKSTLSIWRYRFNLLYLLWAADGLGFEAYLMIKNYPFGIWRYEPFAYYFYHHKHLYDQYLMAILWLFLAFIVYVHHVMYHLPTNTKYWQSVYEIYVTQQDWYYQCTIKDERKLGKIYSKKYQDIMARIKDFKTLYIPIPKVFIKYWIKLDMFVRLENLDKVKFFNSPLSIRPNLSLKIRTRNIVLLIVMDKINCVIILFYLFLCALFAIAYFPVILGPFPWYASIMVVPLITVVFYYISQIIMLAMFFYCWGAIEFYSTGQHCKQMNRKLEQLIKQFKRVGTLPIWYSRVLHRILQDHLRICVIIINNNRILSRVTFAFLLTNIPINIYFISKISLLNAYPAERAIFGAFFVGQAVAYCLLILVADQGANVHAIEKYLPAIQQMLIRDPGWLWYKMKINDLYKRLVIGQKYTLTIGSIKEFTRFTVMEIGCIYIGYLLMAFSQIMESKEKK